MRDEKKFNDTYKRAKWFTGFHKKGVWFIPTEDGYHISVVKPRAGMLPAGARAVFYNRNMDITDEVEAENETAKM